MGNLPDGTVTFMFTDIEDSTGLNTSFGDEAYRALLERHHQLIRAELSAHGGEEIATEGDSFFAVFTKPRSALDAAVAIEHALETSPWAEDRPPTVRIGLHVGTGLVGADNYVGIDVNKANRVASAGHGMQILLSKATVEALGGDLPPDGSLSYLGKYRLQGFKEPESIYQFTGAGLPALFPPLRTPRAESRLPAPLSDFIGRAREIEAGLEAVAANRLVTLTGPGGTGKTRLALQLARRLEDEFDHGAYFVPLAAAREPQHIAGAILDTLGLRSAVTSDPEEHVADYLAEKSVLLILDNFEQLLEGAHVVSSLLGRAPGLKVIVTSRIPLHLPGEREVPVPPLDVPEPGASSAEVGSTEGVQLFARRAASVRPDFRLGAENLGTIATITRSLDGLPLAIELAASRMRSLTPEVILERLGNRLLSSHSPGLPPRQQTIVNAISWSYDLLDDALRRLFEELSVFTGSFGLAEAERICVGGTDVLDGLTRLVDQSLLRQTETTGEPRFRMLTVIREFAYAALVARSGEQEALDRHAAVYLPIAEEAAHEILTSRQGYWLRRLNADQDNLRSALEHVISTGDADSACRFVTALWRFWQIKGQLSEGMGYVESALALEPPEDRVVLGRALTAMAGLVYWQGDWARTLEPYRAALEIFEGSGEEAEIAEALYNLSFPLGYMGELDEAEAVLRRSLEISERARRMIGVGRAYWGLGNLAANREDWAGVVTHCGRSAQIFSDIDAPFDLGWARFMEAYGHLRQSELDSAKTSLRLASDLFSGVGDLTAMALILDSLSVLMLRSGNRNRSAFFAGAARRIKTDTGIKIDEVDIGQWPDSVEFLTSLDAECRAAFDEGGAADLTEVISELRSVLD